MSKLTRIQVRWATHEDLLIESSLLSPLLLDAGLNLLTREVASLLYRKLLLIKGCALIFDYYRRPPRRYDWPFED